MLKRSSLAALTFFCILLSSAAFDSSVAGAEDLADFVQARDPLELVFVDVQAAAWLPGPVTFMDNHRVSLHAGAELGARVLYVRDHALYVIGAFTFSPQQLRAHLQEKETSMYTGYAGVRYVPGMICAAEGMGCPFAELGLGLAWETAEPEPGHQGPAGDVLLMASLGYRLRLAGHFTLGARVDLAYLDEAHDSQIGWLTPGVFAGLSF